MIRRESTGSLYSSLLLSWRRKDRRICLNQKILVVNDVPGAGKVASNINIPVLVAGQLETAILPTKILSSQTGSYYSPPAEVTEDTMFTRFFKHWQENQIHFDGILLGYCAFPSQLTEVQEFYQQEIDQGRRIKLIVDPIMADHGQFYSGFDESYLRSYHDLFPLIDLLTPNLTEACLLTDTQYQEQFSEVEICHLARKLADRGIKEVIITGVQLAENEIGFYHYSSETERGNYYGHRYFKHNFFGTGDLTVSLLAAFCLYQCPLDQSLRWIACFIESTLAETLDQAKPPQEGIAFEGKIGEIYEKFDQIKQALEAKDFK